MKRNRAIAKIMRLLKFPKKDVSIVIETGTHHGWGSIALSSFFKKVYTIELSTDLYNDNLKSINNPKIIFLQGHSPDILSTLIHEIHQRYVLFLDAHGSGEDTTFHKSVGRLGSPAIDEILACKDNPPEYILIDDMSDFDNISDYPDRNDIINAVEKIGKYSNFILDIYKGTFVFRREN